jgi:hypothetical protein
MFALSKVVSVPHVIQQRAAVTSHGDQMSCKAPRSVNVTRGLCDREVGLYAQQLRA